MAFFQIGKDGKSDITTTSGASLTETVVSPATFLYY